MRVAQLELEAGQMDGRAVRHWNSTGDEHYDILLRTFLVFVTSDRTCPLIGQSLPRGAGLGGHVPNPSAVESGVEALDKYRWPGVCFIPRNLHSLNHFEYTKDEL
jgi:hypothetical protein